MSLKDIQVEISALRKMHRGIEREIKGLNGRAADQTLITPLKRKKLAVKERMNRLEKQAAAIQMQNSASMAAAPVTETS
ncbi:DUF465 domain-containing protein [Candidatus Pacebacteria bacterium]|nr:DUF465 domain-containing protein [Candidatus Paceibacterota bacterium]